MTNFKIKLTFFVLNALVTADFVTARPYNETLHNNTFSDIVLDFSRNSTNEDFHLPVDSNSDTLRVASEDETAEQTNKNSKTEMEAIVNAEHDRDVLILTKNNLKEQPKVLEMPTEDAAALEKQLNTSSPLLEKIIDSEMGREETLTDIQLRPEMEFGEELPRFEFLISGKINDTNSYGSVLNELNRNELDKERNSSDFMRKSEYVELVALGKNINLSENKSANYLTNITSHEVDDEMEPDTSFTDVQTLFAACFATLVPLLAVLFAFLCIRCMCRRWCPGCCKEADSTDSESSDHKQDATHPIKTPIESTGTGGETLDTDGDTPVSNGSIITMTLKNNHLIVETEERSDITKNGRETKMKYSPDNDGIFVVEVQQSAPYRPNLKSVQNSPPHDPQVSTNQALIHRVPEELETGVVTSLTDLDERSESEKAKGLALSNTGLSISDLSMSSIGSQIASYSYGNQIGYEQGPFGYPVYAGYEVPKEDIGDGIIHDSSREPLLCKTPTDPDKPVVTAAIFKQDSIIGNDVLQGPGYCIEGSSDGPLLSDVQAREVSLQHIHEQMEKKLENGLEAPTEVKIESPKKHVPLSRSDSLPNRILQEKVPEPIVDKSAAMNTIEDEDEDEVPSKEMLKGKRASLPIIRTEMYESVTDEILSSPLMFENVSNESSPAVEKLTDLQPPMITITEETEPNFTLDEDGS